MFNGFLYCFLVSLFHMCTIDLLLAEPYLACSGPGDGALSPCPPIRPPAPVYHPATLFKTNPSSGESGWGLKSAQIFLRCGALLQRAPSLHLWLLAIKNSFVVEAFGALAQVKYLQDRISHFILFYFALFPSTASQTFSLWCSRDALLGFLNIQEQLFH